MLSSHIYKLAVVAMELIRVLNQSEPLTAKSDAITYWPTTPSVFVHLRIGLEFFQKESGAIKRQGK